MASSSSPVRVWLNGRLVHEREAQGAFRPDSEHFSATLGGGRNRLLVQVAAIKRPEFQLRFRRKATAAGQEELMLKALTGNGNPDNGRKLFFDAEKSLCIKCHRMEDRGERIGPELTAVGGRFSRVYIIESILQPSRTIAPSFETVAVAMKDGRVLTGMRLSETTTTLTLGDSEGRQHEVALSEIEERRVQSVSTMPDGLEKRFTPDEFVDLISFLVSQKQGR